ncbi:uncharacterized protein LOC133310666 isoform X2 [Gastrolobium bilobum]|uniref:uncharacterized protein LOC133310666 isoform X2 n=1 Tax=Gastrolobium bilobum TaxID=150636 RepID=UPI002AAF3732|nr:uncharacterized protein LOC133310666 isoform X2 [Gastrolobium bilobum]
MNRTSLLSSPLLSRKPHGRTQRRTMLASHFPSSSPNREPMGREQKHLSTFPYSFLASVERQQLRSCNRSSFFTLFIVGRRPTFKEVRVKGHSLFAGGLGVQSKRCAKPLENVDYSGAV